MSSFEGLDGPAGLIGVMRRQIRETPLPARSRTKVMRAAVRRWSSVSAAAVVIGTIVMVLLLSGRLAGKQHGPSAAYPAVPAAFVGWTPTPTKAMAARAKSAATRCRWAAQHKSELGAPLITDARGPYVAVLFVDHKDNYERFCIYGPNLGNQGGSLIKSPLFASPSPNSIQHSGEEGSCNPSTGRAVGEMYGQAGTNVAGATFHLANGAAVRATVRKGFYVVWWPWPTSPSNIIVRTKLNGTQDIRLRGSHHAWC